MEENVIVEYEALLDGIFVRKVNRFICEVEINGLVENVHIKTTGRLVELLHEGAAVLVEPASNKERKTRYSLIAVMGNSGLVNVDSQLPNKVMWNALTSGELSPFGKVNALRKEVKFGRSRFDLYYERGSVQGFVEVKGVTFAEDGVAKFPDAPSERARKHVQELTEIVVAGNEGAVVFIVQVPGCSVVKPYVEMDPAFAEVLELAVASGVRIFAYEITMDGRKAKIVRELPIQIED